MGATMVNDPHPILMILQLHVTFITYINRAFSGSPWWGEINMATSPLPSRDPHGGEKSIWLHHPRLLEVPMVGRNQYGHITRAFLGSHDGETSIRLHHPWLLGVPMAGRNQPSKECMWWKRAKKG